MIDNMLNYLATETIFGISAGLFVLFIISRFFHEINYQRVEKRIERETKGMTEEEKKEHIKEIDFVKSPIINKIAKIFTITVFLALSLMLIYVLIK
jgi:hypothetical protein